MKQVPKLILITILAFGFLLLASLPVLADEPPPPNPEPFAASLDPIVCRAKTLFGPSATDDAIGGLGSAPNPIATRIGVLANTAFLLAGLAFLIFTVYSGIQWMMAGGNEETVKKARTRIVRATIGLAIMLGSWIITNFILNVAFKPSGPSRGGLEYGPFRLEQR